MRIYASFYASTDSKWDCSKCLHSDRHPEHVVQRMREMKGCWSGDKVLYTINGLEFKSCLGNYYSPEFNSIFMMFKMFKRGTMPYPGTLAEQPAKLVETMNIIYNLEAEHREKELEKSKHQNK